MDLAISVLAFATALSTPLPRYFDLSPSRSSSASCSPVEAPDGTAARPNAPPSRMTSASTVGLPRESMTWRAWTLAILVDMVVYSPELKGIDNFTGISGRGTKKPTGIDERTKTRRAVICSALMYGDSNRVAVIPCIEMDGH